MERTNGAVYQFRVTLRDVMPPVWRRIQIGENVTLEELHRVLQIALGWQDCHLHEFTIGKRAYGVPDLDDPMSGHTVVDERRTRLSEVGLRVGESFRYLYDFGDGWEHDVLLEAIVMPEPEGKYPVCLAGERAAPPEDVGGVPGYENYREALRDPAHEEHEDLLAWRGPFDPEAFSAEQVNRILWRKTGAKKSAVRKSARGAR